LKRSFFVHIIQDSLYSRSVFPCVSRQSDRNVIVIHTEPLYLSYDPWITSCYSEIRSVEVAPIILLLALLIYSFHFRSAFPARCRNWFSQFQCFTLSRKNGTFSSPPSPSTLTYDLDQRIWP